MSNVAIETVEYVMFQNKKAQIQNPIFLHLKLTEADRISENFQTDFENVQTVLYASLYSSEDPYFQHVGCTVKRELESSEDSRSV